MHSYLCVGTRNCVVARYNRVSGQGLCTLLLAHCLVIHVCCALYTCSLQLLRLCFAAGVTTPIIERIMGLLERMRFPSLSDRLYCYSKDRGGQQRAHSRYNTKALLFSFFFRLLRLLLLAGLFSPLLVQ